MGVVEGLKTISSAKFYGKGGRQGCADRRVAKDGDRELTGTYLQRVGTALPANLSLAPPKQPQ